MLKLKLIHVSKNDPKKQIYLYGETKAQVTNYYWPTYPMLVSKGSTDK